MSIAKLLLLRYVHLHSPDMRQLQRSQISMENLIVFGFVGDFWCFFVKHEDREFLTPPVIYKALIIRSHKIKYLFVALKN